ncbi:unnamed protein product [Nezara viridula]|uniref:Uncharacterized protein n=1 Tax=Nezara viridula TaxID=85310 RepID=A0A9P0MPB7_NEZVI|nr:unnamed protein product [Nezara viridula]
MVFIYHLPHVHLWHHSFKIFHIALSLCHGHLLTKIRGRKLKRKTPTILSVNV